MSTISMLRKKASAGLLEVEDLLKAAVKRPPKLEAELLVLAHQHAWSSTGTASDGSRIAPLAKWAAVAGAYATGGLSALDPYLQAQDARFAIVLIQELGSLEAVEFLMRSLSHVVKAPSSNVQLALHMASALNLMLSFKPAFAVPPPLAGAVQSFLIQLFPLASTDVDRGSVILALRGVGDAQAVQFVVRTPALKSPWHTCKQATLRALRKRMSRHGL